jgi:predicted nucleotidyltransferase
MSIEKEEYPGTPRHQALLRAIVSRYQDDPRIRAVVVFGSLGRGDWDAFSDLDLDVVLVDGVQVDVDREVAGLADPFSAAGERVALVVPDGADAVDVVLESLMQLSIRFHALGTTKPAIVASMQVLAGSLDRGQIAAAGLANRKPSDEPLDRLLDRCVRYAAVADVGLRRSQAWITVEVLHRMRGILMELFARSRGGGRSYQRFEAEAEEWLQERLGATLPRYALPSMRDALLRLLDILERDLEPLTAGQLELGDAQRAVLERVRLSQDSGGDR